MLLKWTEMNKSCRIPEADTVNYKLPVISLAELLQQMFLLQLATKATCCSGAKGMDGTVLLVGAMQINIPPSSSTTAASLQRVIPRNRAVTIWQLGKNQPGGKKGMRKGRRGKEKKECTTVVAADHLVHVREMSEWKLWQNKVLQSGANWTVTKRGCSSLPPKSIHMVSEAYEKVSSNFTRPHIILILNNFLYFHISSAPGKANKIKCS